MSAVFPYRHAVISHNIRTVAPAYSINSGPRVIRNCTWTSPRKVLGTKGVHKAILETVNTLIVDLDCLGSITTSQISFYSLYS